MENNEEIPEIETKSINGVEITNLEYAKIAMICDYLILDRFQNHDYFLKFFHTPYLYVLENVPVVQRSLMKIRERLEKTDVVFLDYNTNCDIADYSKPLSHAGLVKLYLEGRYPSIENREKYEETNETIVYGSTCQDIVNAITSHPKYNAKKHKTYVDTIITLKLTNMKEIAGLSDGKRDGWKSIIRGVQKQNNDIQLTLF